MPKLTDAQRSMLEWISRNPGRAPASSRGPTRKMLARMVCAGWLYEHPPNEITPAGRAALQQKDQA